MASETMAPLTRTFALAVLLGPLAGPGDLPNASGDAGDRIACAVIVR